MTHLPTTEWTELAHRMDDGLDVTLVWIHGHGADETLVSVYDTHEGSYFEIPARPDRAMDVYYHPFAYRDDTRLAA